jgi:two-component system cell cycle sensor histidine kinase/response regulator CckA
MDAGIIRVLLLEDEDAHAEAIRRGLKSSSTHFSIKTVATLREYRESVAADPPDIALLDMVLPDGDALELLAAPQEVNPFPRVVMTSHGDEQTAVAAMKAGALDYIVKSPHTFADMPRLVTHAMDHWQLLEQRRQAQDLQRISEERYRSVVENANEVIIVAQDGLVKFANRKMEELSGYLRDELLSLAFIEFVHPDDRQFLVESDFHKLSGDKFKAAHPVRMIDKQGQVVWMEISAVVINWEGRRATLNFISDITGRRRSEEALRESEEKYRNLVELLREGIWVIDEDARTTYVNTGMAGMLGYTVEEMLGKELFSFMDEDGRESAAQNVERRRKGISETHEFEFLRKNGTKTYASLSTTPVTDKDGKYLGAVAVVQDITDRKRLEEEQKRVERLESVGLLAGGIAHDFNNILTAILGNISLAAMEAAPGSELQSSLGQAEKASLRAKDLTKQLLTFSKGGAPVKTLASLPGLLRDTAGFALRGSNVKCHFSIPPELWHAEIDEGQVSQVIHNLVINAQQAMPAGGTIEVTAGNMALSETLSLGRGLPLQAGNYVRIAVVDHGTGIPADHLDKIFDPFFTTKHKGSGLGLATSFSIARQHGGHLSVESEIGSGSTFYLYLPASTQKSTPEQDKEEPVKPVGKARILVMDDEKGVREVAGRMLRHIGYEDVEYAADGAGAVSLYKAAMESGRPLTTVILDLTIAGGMGGMETVKALRKIDPSVKAIVSSGYADDSVMAGYREHGFSGMIAKPYTLKQLRKALGDVIGQE